MPLYEGYLLYTTYRASVCDVLNEVCERRGQKMHQICGQTRTKRGKGKIPKSCGRSLVEFLDVGIHTSLECAERVSSSSTMKNDIAKAKTSN